MNYIGVSYNYSIPTEDKKSYIDKKQEKCWVYK